MKKVLVIVCLITSLVLPIFSADSKDLAKSVISYLDKSGYKSIKLSDLDGIPKGSLMTYAKEYLYPRFADKTSKLYGKTAYIKWDNKEIAKIIKVDCFEGKEDVVFTFIYNGKTGKLVEDKKLKSGGKIVWD